MKRFITLSLCILATVQVWACCFTGHPHYYVFSAFPVSAMSYGQADEAASAKFWADYTGGKANEWSLSEFCNGNVDCSASSQNPIVATAYKKNDTETIEYLKSLNSYFRCANVVYNTNEWNYPSKEDIEQSKSTLKSLRAKAMNYNGSTYKAQYLLMAMRCNKALGLHTANIKLWKANGYNIPKTNPLRHQALGIYAHALLQTDKRDEAMKYYASVGDMASIKWMVRKQRNLKGIKEVYAGDSNSPALPFLVQDFVNNAQETQDTKDLEIIKSVDAKAIYKDEIIQFIQFANQVVAEGKSKTPTLWMTAAGCLTSMQGEPRKALTMLNKAMEMNGTQRMKDNARVCRLSVLCENHPTLNTPEDQLAAELKWLQGMNKEASKTADMHYGQVMVRFLYHGLIPAYQKRGDPNMATSLTGLIYNTDEENKYISGEYKVALDKLSSTEMISYQSFVHNKNVSDLAKWANNMSGKNLTNNDFNDYIGTKLMREGRFADAIPYLEKLPLSFISEQAISSYMARRTYTDEAWLKRVRVENETPTKVSANQKLQFCRDYVALEGKTDLNSRYKLATMLYQASYKGDCWYLTRYGKSVSDTMCYKDEANLIKMAINHLTAVSQSSDFMLKQKALYALAFIPQGEDLISTKYTADYSKSYLALNQSTPQYGAMLNLLNFYNANRANVAPFVSKCDVLKKFQQLLPKKKTTSNKKKTPTRRRR